MNSGRASNARLTASTRCRIARASSRSFRVSSSIDSASPGDVVYDPFMGRGTTLLEAALSGRTPAGCDINPLSAMLAQPRLSPPTERDVVARLAELDLSTTRRARPSSRSFITPTRCARSAPCANICWRGTAAARSMPWIGGFGWSRSIASRGILRGSSPCTPFLRIRPHPRRRRRRSTVGGNRFRRGATCAR